MAQYNFGVGTVIGKRTDVSLTMPAFFGVCQDWELNIDQTLVELMGQNKDAVDVAPAARKITGKIKFAKLSATSWGNMLLGVNPTINSGFQITGPETKTTTTTTYTAVAGAAYVEDLGVFYAATGVALQPVVSGPTIGQYVAGVSATGTYTIASADAGASVLSFYYSQTDTTQLSMAVGNALMGTGPTIELNMTNPYTVGGVVKKLNFNIPQARIGKSPMQFKNGAYMIPEMDFTAFMNAAGVILNWSMTE